MFAAWARAFLRPCSADRSLSCSSHTTEHKQGKKQREQGKQRSMVGKFRNLRIWCSICSGLEGLNKTPLSRQRGRDKSSGNDIKAEAEDRTKSFISPLLFKSISSQLNPWLYNYTNRSKKDHLSFRVQILESHKDVSWKTRKQRNKQIRDTVAAYYCSSYSVPSWTLGVYYEWLLLRPHEVNSSPAHYVTSAPPDKRTLLLLLCENSIPV